MHIGIPKEIKTKEDRVALIPAAAAELVRHGHEVCLQSGAGLGSGYSDEDYRNVGVHIIEDAAGLYGGAELILKVKEPIEPEYGLLRDDHLLFSFLHLAAIPELARVLQKKGLTAVAFEAVAVNGTLPVLAPMSEIAGRLAVHIGTTLLHGYHGGRGLMLGGLPSSERPCGRPRCRQSRRGRSHRSRPAWGSRDSVRPQPRKPDADARARTQRHGTARISVLNR